MNMQTNVYEENYAEGAQPWPPIQFSGIIFFIHVIIGIIFCPDRWEFMAGVLREDNHFLELNKWFKVNKYTVNL